MMRKLFCCLAVLLSILPCELFADMLIGVVTDEQGKPVAGARIDIAVAAPKVGRGIFCPSCYLDCKKWTRTNDQGEFVIKGLDSKLKFRVLSTAPAKRTRMTDWIDPSTETAKLVLSEFPADAPATRILEGRIISTDGTPIPGALIEPYGAQTTEKRWWGAVDILATVSDDDGHFRMLLNTPDYLGVDLSVLADGYAGTRCVLLKPGEQVHEVKVPVGTSVTGQLVFKGQPQAGIRVAVVQTERGVENHFIKSVMSVTDKNGRFEFNSLPANQPYAIYSPVGEADPQESKRRAKILTTKRFNARGDGQSRDLGALELTDSLSVSGKFKMTDGSPVPNGLRMSLSREPAWDLIEVSVDPQGRFEIAGLPPETYEFVINARQIRIDARRLQFQQVRPNSFAVRLMESREGILIPLEADHPAPPRVDVANAIPATPAKAAPAEENLEIEPSKGPGQSGTGSVVEFTDEPVPVDGPKIRVRGTIISAKRERIAGATVLLRAKIGGTFYSNGSITNRDVLARTKSDANGRFVFSSVPIPLRHAAIITGLMLDEGGVEVLAYADGYGLATTDVSSLDNSTPLRVVLAPEAEVRGVVTDDSGKVVRDARLEVWGMTGVSGAISHVMNNPGDLNLGMSQVNLATSTGGDGAFVLKHLPVDRRVVVVVTADGFTRTVLAIETTLPQSGGPKRYEEEMWKDRIVVQKSPVEIRLVSKPTLQIRVVDHDGQPVKDGVVQYEKTDGGQQTAPESKPISDETGIVTFLALEPGSWRLRYESDPLNPRLGTSLVMKEGNASVQQPVEIRLPESRWVTGRVTNSDSGEPVVGATVISHWTQSKQDEVMAFSRCTSRENGEFRVPVALGHNRIWVSNEPYGFINESPNPPGERMGRKLIEVTEQGELPAVELTLSPGLIVEGTVRDESGKPLASALVRAEQTQRTYRRYAARTDVEGRYRIAGLAPTESTMLTVAVGGVADRKTLEAAIGKDPFQVRRQTVDLTLNPGVQLTGRVMKDGRPQAGVKMELTRSLPGQRNRSNLFVTVTTDESGRYTVGGLDPGDVYRFNIVTKDKSIAADWKHQLPFVQTIPANANGVIELPDANLITSNQSLSGIVVDPDGNPVVSIRVSASLGRGGQLARRDNAPPPWTETDKSGRFKLTHLPDDDIELMAYKPNPAGGQILYPVRMTPIRNQTDIRIVLDPTLLDEIENLDPVDKAPRRRGIQQPPKQ